MPSSKVLKSVAEVVKEAIKKADAEKAVGKTKEILESQTPPATTPRGGPLLPRSQGMYPPDVPQVDLPRQKGVDKARAEGKKPKYTERMQSLLDSPTVRKKVDKLIAKGQDLGMKEWYGTEPLRQAALDVISPQQYESLMAQLASASQRNPVDQQNLMGSYLYYLQQQGRLDPDALLLTNKLKEQGIEGIEAPLIELPEGYGSLAQSAIFNRGKQIAAGDIEGALPPEKKLGTFYRNLLGNLQPVTVDVNAVRGPVIEAGDPRWLASKLVEKDEAGKVKNVYFPRQMVEEGKMSVREAKERPGFWEAAPSGSEYAGFEDLWQRAARREGVRPAEAQALGWYGSGDVTALKTKPELYIENLERLLSRTADVTGKSPLEVLRQFLKGEEFLRKAEGGAVMMNQGGNPDVTDSGRIDLNAQYELARGGAAIMKRGGKAKGETLASMDTGKVETRKAPGAEKAERILSGAAELLPGVAAGKSAIEGEYQKALIEAGLDVAGGPLAKGLGAAIPAVAGIFIGSNARLWDKAAAKEFKKLEKAGVSNEEAFKQTNTFRSPDGELRQEISDRPARLKGEKLRDISGALQLNVDAPQKAKLEKMYADIFDQMKSSGTDAPLSQLIYHPELFKAYPELESLRGRYNIIPSMPETGYYNLGSPTTPPRLGAEGPTPESARSSMLHEIQHAIQHLEGFGMGGNPEMGMTMLPRSMDAVDYLNQLRKSKMNLLDEQARLAKEFKESGSQYTLDNPLVQKSIELPNKIDDVDQAIEGIVQGYFYPMYKRMAGEAESRAIQARRQMSPQELRDVFPLSSYDVPVDQLIVKRVPPYANGGAVMMADGGAIGKNVGRGMARLTRSRQPLDPKEIQAMMLDVPAGVGIPFAEAGAEYLRGNVEDAKTSAAIDAALTAVPVASALAKPAYRAVKKGVQKAAPAVREAARDVLESGVESGVILDPRMQAIAYHGSPHKFEKFDASKIGTGEGAQAYGHGLYFAESPSVAKTYKAKLSESKPVSDEDISFDVAHFMGDDIGEHAAERADVIHHRGSDIQYVFEDGSVGVLDSEGRFTPYGQPEGHLYTVDIPDESVTRMLDWDKPLSEQPEAVQKALSKADIAGNASYFVQNPNEGTLGEMYRSLANQHGAPAVSEFLKSQGIPGIKYLDATSRSAGEGTHNFVVFPGEEESAKILERKKKGGVVVMQRGGKMKKQSLEEMFHAKGRQALMDFENATKKRKG